MDLGGSMNMDGLTMSVPQLWKQWGLCVRCGGWPLVTRTRCISHAPARQSKPILTGEKKSRAAHAGRTTNRHEQPA